MNAPDRPSKTARLEDFPFRLTETIRYSDQDPNRHVNNAVFATFFETGRVSLTRNPAYSLMPEGTSWMLARLAIDFTGEVHWPGTVETGLGVERIGRTSVTYRQAVFYKGACVALGEAVTVLADATTRRPTPLPADVIAKFQPWMMAAPRA